MEGCKGGSVLLLSLTCLKTSWCIMKEQPGLWSSLCSDIVSTTVVQSSVLVTLWCRFSPFVLLSCTPLHRATPVTSGALAIVDEVASHPEIGIKADARTSFAPAIRELDDFKT